MKGRLRVLLVGAAGVLAAAGGPAWGADDDKWVVRNKVDEEVRFRKDRGLSKARTLGQVDIDKKLNSHDLFSKFKLHATLRGSYDAVYDLNPTEYGNDAGSSVSFVNHNTGTVVAHGGGLRPAGGGFDLTRNPNEGMELLDSFRDADSGVNFGVPVRPCDEDSRGCIKGYMDSSKRELAAPEFNDRLDVLRELYVDAELPVGRSDTLALRFGRQQLVWGRTDLFRVLDVVNPVDYSRNNIYDELQDIRIPMGMLRADYRMGARGPFDDLNVQGVWMWEKFRPNNLGQAGSPNNPLGAAAFFRGMKNCWDNGCTVANFAGGNTATDFGPHQIGIRQANLPEWTLANTTYGGKVEGEIKGIGFSLNALSTFSQMPSLRGGIPADSIFTAGVENQAWDNLIAFDIDFPRIQVYGGSLDFAVDPIDTAFRFETAYTQGEEFANTARKRLFSESDVLRYVVGVDKNIMIPALNSRRAFLVSGQVFGQHILEHELNETPTGRTGIPDFKDNWTGTLLVKGWYASDTVSPQVVMARDFRAQANVVEPSVEWTPSALWRFRLGANHKWGDYKHTWDDVRSATPFTGGGASNGSLAGMEPLGRFRSGILGMAHEETEVFANATLRF